MNTNTDKAKCCFIGRDRPCDNLAEYEIRELPLTKEGYTHSCKDHVMELLFDTPANEVVRLLAPGNAAPVYR